MGARSRDLAVVNFVAALGMIATLSDQPMPLLRVLFGLPLVFLCPGYALTAAFFSSRTPALAQEPGDAVPARRWPEWLLFSLGLSLGVTILGGYLLDGTPWGLNPAAWALLLGGVTAAASGAALVLRQRHPAPILPPALPRRQSGRQPTALFVGAVLLVAVAFGIVQDGARAVPDSAFTQFWILPDSGGQPATVRVGVHNQEPAALHYRLVVAAGGIRAAEWPVLTLEPGATWETTVVLPATASATAPIEANLYRADQPATIYRAVTLRRDR